ncbi:MAG TPA: hypothetical protein PLS84_00815 [Salinivirgaceae bacterium]|nr:hypothetical protein [Salinivirgaceae bacterium]
MRKLLTFTIFLLTTLFIVSCTKKEKDIIFCNITVGNHKPAFDRIALYNNGLYLENIYKHKIVLLDKTISSSGNKLTGKGDVLELTLLTSTSSSPEGNYSFSDLEEANILFNGYFAKGYNFDQQNMVSMSVIEGGEVEIVPYNKDQNYKSINVKLKTVDGDSIRGSLLLPFISINNAVY